MIPSERELEDGLLFPLSGGGQLRASTGESANLEKMGKEWSIGFIFW